MEKGFDVIIVLTRNSSQEEFWQKKVRSLSGIICRNNSLIITVAQSWKGDPGTGLGFLHAYTLAQEKAKFKYRKDLFQMQKAGASIALYLANSVEKQLFPLLACENNSIASLKLPSHHYNGAHTLLETVIKQTNQFFSDNREGRLSVFFIYQLFFPVPSFIYRPGQHIDLFCQEEPKVFESEDRRTSMAHTPIGKNLNSFSLSTEMTFALLNEFQPELSAQKGSLDSNFHFWMPLTFDYAVFLTLNPAPEDQMQFHRMKDFRKKCKKELESLPLFQAIDIGASGYYWNFGSVRSFRQSILKLTESSPEGCFMRHFFAIDQLVDPLFGNRVIIDHHSCLINCHIHGGSIKNSVLIGVDADSVEVDCCIAINSQFSSLISANSLLYHVQETKPLKLAAGTVRTDAFLSNEKKRFCIYSELTRDASQDWNRILPQNPFSFSTIHKMVQK